MPQSPPEVTLTLTEEQHAALFVGLYPGDGKESVALALCGRHAGERRHRLLVREIHVLPESAYTERTPVKVTWSIDGVTHILDKAEQEGLSVIKIHSHPTGFRDFSGTDDISDQKLFPCIHGWAEADIPHASVIMLPDGEMFGRYSWGNKTFHSLKQINVVGADLHFWPAQKVLPNKFQEFTASQAQAFGQGTTDMLKQLSIAVVGCSGTGSIIVEQLARLGAGKLILVDPQKTENRNINRILNSTNEDTKNGGRYKTDVLADAVKRMGLGTEVASYPTDLWDIATLKAVAECDLVFGCMDGHRGRYLLNRLATYYTLPYFDIGVRLDAFLDENQRNKIRQITGSLQYLIPGMSSLLSREKISMEQVRAEGLRHNDPAAFEQQLKDGYIHGVQESRPAVISINMYASSIAVNDFLARIHPYREEANTEIAEIEFCLSGLDLFTSSESVMEQDEQLRQYVGFGDVIPLLGLPGLI